MRHASIIDNLVPATFVAAPHGIRLPNVFVARGSARALAQPAEARLREVCAPHERVLPAAAAAEVTVTPWPA